jgi:hypothetical protein
MIYLSIIVGIFILFALVSVWRGKCEYCGINFILHKKYSCILVCETVYLCGPCYRGGYRVSRKGR